MDFINSIPQAFAYIGGHPDEFKGFLSTHLQYTFWSVAIAFAFAFPLGMLASRSRFASVLSLNAGGVLRAVPSVAILFVLYPYLGLANPDSVLGWPPSPVLTALVVLAFLPILTNTNVGFRQVDPAVREAAYGMGMTTLQVLRRIELPLAAPIVIAGLRTATVDVIATATVAPFIGGGGLGFYIYQGLSLGVSGATVLIVGVVSVALLALSAEVTLGFGELITRRASGQA